MQGVYCRDQRLLSAGPAWSVRPCGTRCLDLLVCQISVLGVYRDVNAPLVFAIRQRRRAVNNNLPISQGKRAAVEQRCVSKFFPSPCTGRHRSKEQQRFLALHYPVEGELNVIRVWRFQRSNTGHCHLVCYYICSRCYSFGSMGQVNWPRSPILVNYGTQAVEQNSVRQTTARSHNSTTARRRPQCTM